MASDKDTDAPTNMLFFFDGEEVRKFIDDNEAGKDDILEPTTEIRPSHLIYAVGRFLQHVEARKRPMRCIKCGHPFANMQEIVAFTFLVPLIKGGGLASVSAACFSCTGEVRLLGRVEGMKALEKNAMDSMLYEAQRSGAYIVNTNVSKTIQ